MVVDQSKDQLLVYDTADWKLKREMSVPGLKSSALNDLAFSTNHRCLYLGDHIGKCIHRIRLPSTMSKWPITDHPYGVSVSQNNNVLVTCRQVRKLLEYTGDGELLREISLALKSPCHSVQLSADMFLVVYGYHGDPARGVVVVDATGRVQHRTRYGDNGLNFPSHCAVTNNGCVYVVDVSNQRVILMSPDLQYVRDVVSRGRDNLTWWPVRICLDPTSKHLYVVDSDTRSGRVVVCDTCDH